MPDLSAGVRLGSSLVLERPIGRGGMGEVWLATDELLDRPVAVKWWSAAGDPDAAALKLLLEARAAARVVHPGVVAVHGIGDFAGRPYIEMEWVDGPSLRSWWQVAPRTVAERAAVVAQVALALDAAHGQGVIHCDVKPENVLLRGDSAGAWVAKLADFGLARSQRDGLVRAPLSHGTAAYLAPELAEEPPTQASDIFALAALAYESLTGAPPPREHWRQAPQLSAHPKLPAPAIAVLQRGLEAKPAARWPSAAALADALLAALDLPAWTGGSRGLPALAPAATSLEVALPLPNWSSDHAAEILAGLLAALIHHPESLEKAYGSPVRADAVRALLATGLAEQGPSGLRLAAGADREACLARLPGRLQRLVLGRAAMALEAAGPRQTATRDEAVQLYVAARRLGDAARLLLQSAEATLNARQRRQHLARAVALSASPTRPRAWLETLLLIIEWDVRCGAVDWVRGPLAEAQGVIVEARLPAGDPLRLRVALADAAVRLAQGDPQAALARLKALPEGLEWQDDLAGRAEALREACAVELALPAAALPHWPRAGTEAAAAQRQLALARRALLAGDIVGAERGAARALAIAEERGDAMDAGHALVFASALALQRDKPSTAWHTAADALAVLRPIGAVQATAEAWLQRARAAQAQKRPWIALHALSHAQAIAEELGIGRLHAALLPLLVQSALEAGEIEQARVWQERLEARRKGIGER